MNFTEKEKELIRRMVFIAQSQTAGEGDYQGWRARDFKKLDEILEKISDKPAPKPIPFTNMREYNALLDVQLPFRPKP